MSATLTERTVLPGEPTQRMADLLVALRSHGRPALVAGDGTHIELPDELYEVLKDVVTALSQGLAITVARQHTVSRPARRPTFWASPGLRSFGCSK